MSDTPDEKLIRSIIKDILSEVDQQRFGKGFPGSTYDYATATAIDVSSVSGDAAANAEAELAHWVGKKGNDPSMKSRLIAYAKNIGKGEDFFPAKPWSAGFISWVMQNEPGFTKSASHSTYMRKAKKARDAGATTGFVAYRPKELEPGGPERGDLVCNPRKGSGDGYDNVGSYNHCDVFVGGGEQIGGNLSNSSRKDTYRPDRESMVIKKLGESAIREIVKDLLDEVGEQRYGSGFPGSTPSYGTSAGWDDPAQSDWGGASLDYTPSGTAKRISSKVKVNELIKNAWEWLSPLLPDGSKMTSGGRTQADQDRIIRDYASSKLRMSVGNTSAELDVAHSALKKANYVIARRIGRGHGSWEAMDISGADLRQIQQAVIAVSDDPDIPVKFNPFQKGVKNRSIFEPKQAVHVGIASASPPDPQRIARVIAKYTQSGMGSGRIGIGEAKIREIISGAIDEVGGQKYGGSSGRGGGTGTGAGGSGTLEGDPSGDKGKSDTSGNKIFKMNVGQKPRVLFFYPGIGKNGTQTHVSSVISRLPKANNLIIVLAKKNNTPFSSLRASAKSALGNLSQGDLRLGGWSGGATGLASAQKSGLSFKKIIYADPTPTELLKISNHKGAILLYNPKTWKSLGLMQKQKELAAKMLNKSVDEIPDTGTGGSHNDILDKALRSLMS